MPTEIDPSKWRRVPLRSVLLDFQTGKRPRGGVRGIEEGILSIGGEHVHADGHVDLSTPRWIPVDFAKTLKNGRTLPDDILIVKDGATTGKVAIADLGFSTFEAYVNEHVFLCRVNTDVILPRFLYHFLRSDFGKAAILEDFRGAAQGGISRAVVDKVRAPLPSLPVQERVLGEIEKATASIAGIRRELIRINMLMVQYPPNFIDAIMSQAFEELQPSVEQLRNLVDKRGIPYGIVQTGSPSRSGVATVRGGDIKDFVVPKEALKLVDPRIASRYGRTQLRGGEVLLSIRGTVGNAAAVGEEFAGCNISREVAMIPPSEKVIPAFIAYFLATSNAQAFLAGHTQGVAQRGINLADLRNLPVPVPVLAQQRVIVAQIDSALKTTRFLISEVGRALALLLRLEQAIFRTAFGLGE